MGVSKGEWFFLVRGFFCCLVNTHSLVLDGGTIGTKHELLRSGGEVGETSDGEIFMIEVWVFAENLLCLDGGSQHGDTMS